MVTYEEALKLTIEGDAVFLVGSGFSTGAENVSENEDRHLLVGSELAKELVLCQDLAQNKMRSFATKLLTENRPSHTFFQSR